jgi:Protein of unknown function (DUF3433)
MKRPKLKGQSFLPSEQISPTQPFQGLTIPRRPLPPQSTIALHEYLNSGKLQNSNLTIHVSDHGTQENSQWAQTRRELWSPIWLRRSTLLAFMALFAAFDASLIALWRFNKAQNGFRPTLSSNHYAWTYGPTAVLVVVLGLWRQVDYHCKIIQPWQQMRKGATNAAQSVLLDYISPLNITSFIRAVRYRHIPVAASIAGFATLKLIILFSTGLLVMTPTSVSDTFLATITTKFDGSSFWDGISSGRSAALRIWKHVPYDNVSPSPVYTYLGLLKGEISDPIGTVDGKAFQSFKVAPYPTLSRISLHVKAFVPNITCEVAQTTPWYTFEERLAVKFDSATCSAGHEYPEFTVHDSLILEVGWENLSFLISYNMWTVNCSETDDLRYALTVTNVSHSENITSQYGTPTYLTAHGLSTVICKFDYSVKEAVVTHDFDKDSYRVDNLTTGSHLNNLTGLMLGEIIYSSFAAAQRLQVLNLGASFSSPAESLFYVLLRTLNDEQALDRFLSTETLRQSATQVFEGTATQFMQQFYLMANDADTTGNGIGIEERLHIGLVSLWAMVAGFALLVFFSLIVVFTTQTGAVSQDPGPIATSATILVASSGLQRLLHGTGSHRTSRLVERLRSWTFQTNAGENFDVKVARAGALTGPMSEAKVKHGFWIPFAAQYWILALTFGSPLAAIATLEVLHRVSNANMGLVDVSDSENAALYLSRYLSAAVMLLITTSFNTLDFAIASFAPFSLLRSGANSAGRSLYFHLLGEMPPVALLQSLRTLHPGSAFSNTAGIIGSVLTVVASGLWTIDHAVVSHALITASVASSWDVAWPYNALNDSGAAAAFDHIQHGRASLPLSIWNDLVFTDIADVRMFNGRSSIIDSVSQNYTFDVSAARPVLTCDVVQDDYIHIQWTGGEQSMLYIDANPPFPLGCHKRRPNGTDDLTGLNIRDDLFLHSWIGSFDNIDLDPRMDQPNNHAGCPSIGIIFGQTKGNVTSHDDVTVLLCSQKLQQISVEVTYNGNDTHHPRMAHGIPPAPDESSVRYLVNGTNDVDNFAYRIPAQLENLTAFTPEGEELGGHPFIHHLVYGPGGTPLKALTGRANRDRLLKAVQKLYAKYMVLALDMHLRQPIAAGERERLTGTMHRMTARLQINYASKLTLQIMLGTMTLLGMGAFWLTDLRGTLPRNPCSIASTMGFLAGSDLCDPEKPILPKGAEWLGRKEMERVLGGWFFSLGWWTPREGEQVEGHDGQGHNHGHDDAGQALLHQTKKEKDIDRFGIDVGMPKRLGFRETEWWALRRRFRERRAKMRKQSGDSKAESWSE